MTDRREAILARLLAVAQSIAGIVKAARNVTELSEAQRPAIILFDGTESADDTDPKARPGNAPRLITMSPQFEITLGAASEDIGTALNVLRAALMKAVMTDATIAGLVLDREGTRYQGASFGAEGGRVAEGSMQLDFTFTYVLRPDEL